MTTIIYGIHNCDTIKKTIKWLENNAFAFQFHDYRKAGIDEKMLNHFIQALGYEALMNKRGTTYRQLSDEIKNNLNQEKALALMLENPAIIKRPLLLHKGLYHLGFSEKSYQSLFSKDV